MFGSIIGAAGKLIGLISGLFKARERAQAEKTGAIKQQHADAKAELEKQREQLEKAVNRKKGDAAKRLKDGKF